MSAVTRTFDLLDHCLKNFPREDALCRKDGSEWKKYSTEEYARYAYLIAYGLMALGLRRGDRVATVSTNRPEWSFLDMGLALAGAVHVPIYPTISEEEYRYILAHSEARFVFVSDAKLYEKMKPLVDELDSLEELFSFNEVEGARNISEIYALGEGNENHFRGVVGELKNSMSEDEMVTLIYTSGTTGQPKGVMLSHRNIVSNFKAHAQNHRLGYQHRVISFLPLCHVYERSMNYHFQYKGMGIYYVESLGQIIPAVKEVKPHMFNTVPRLLERIYDGIIGKGEQLTGIKRRIFFWAFALGDKFDYQVKFSLGYKLKLAIADKLVFSKWRAALGGNIHYIVSGGAALQERIARVFGAAKICTLEGYGLTETSPVIAVANPATGEMKVGTNGPILPGVQVKLADDGEILVKGPNVMLGYYNEPDLTREVIDDEGWFHTGDVGTLVEGKYLKITDRKKEIFKLSGGKYIAPQMIENKFKESLFIEQMMVIGENQKFASALISPNFDFLHDWCAERKIHFHDNKDLVRNAEVMNQYRKVVREINKVLGQHEEIKRFRLVCEAWSPQSGELSQTLKLRRKFVAQKYKTLIDDIYNNPV